MPRGEGRKNAGSGTWGSVDKRAKGWRARYVGPRRSPPRRAVSVPHQE